MRKKHPTAARDSLGAGLRRYLYFTAAVTGAAILVVEILGAKMLAPYVGTSHFVWTAQIAVTLISLSVGYCFGGWLVDRSANLTRLYLCILVAAIYLCFTIAMCEPIAYACLRFQLAAGALLASLFLFFVPLTLLAVTGPFLIRVLTASVNVVGGQVGRLSAISTLGSVIGTVLIGYVLIPFLPNSITMYLTGGVLFVIVAVYFAVWGRKLPNKAIIVAGVLLGLAAGYGGVKKDLHPRWKNFEQLARSNSNFGQLQVVKRKGGPIRYYLNDYLTQNGYDPDERKSINLFTYMLHGLAHAYTRQTDDVLCIGMGVGIVPMKFAQEGAKVDVVEINEAVVPVAQKYFDLQPEKLNLMIDDGRYYLNGCPPRKYDAIILDAFLGDSSPSHLMTREAFIAMQRALKTGGVLVMNTFGELEASGDFLAASLEKTLQSVFQSVRIHADGQGNMFFVASDQPELVVGWQPKPEDIHKIVGPRVEATFSSIRHTDPKHGIVLTDDYNPVEFYDAANREELRKRVALNMKQD